MTEDADGLWGDLRPMKPDVWFGKDPIRQRAIAESKEVAAWHRATSSLAGKASAAQNKGDMALALVYRHLLRVATNARELNYYKWLRAEGIA